MEQKFLKKIFFGPKFFWIKNFFWNAAHSCQLFFFIRISLSALIFSWTDTTYKQMPIFLDHKYNWIAECVYGIYRVAQKKYSICLQVKCKIKEFIDFYIQLFGILSSF